MTTGRNFIWYASADRAEKIQAYAKKRGKDKPAPINSIMKEMVDFFFKHGGDKRKGE